MLYILTGLERQDNAWTKNLIMAVEKEFSRRKIKFVEEKSIDTILKQCKRSGDVVFISSPATALINPIIEKCNKKGVQVIASNVFQDIGYLRRVHCVRGDIFGIVSVLVSGLKKNHKKNIALYGVNSNSQDDLLLVDAFNNNYCGRYIGVYFNDGDIQTCFGEFLEDIDDIDAVICANDYITINLYERLLRVAPNRAENIVFVSFSNTLLSRIYGKPFTSIDMNINSVSKAVADIYKIVKNTNAQDYRTITIYVDYEIHERGKDSKIFTLGDFNIETRKIYSYPQRFDFNKAFDKDKEIWTLLQIEMQLNQLSEQQLEVLIRVLKNYSNEEIAKELFLALETVKYHLKKIFKIFCCNKKSDLKKLLRDFL